MSLHTGGGQGVVLGPEFGGGGEGTVYAVYSPQGFVFKRYRPVAFSRNPALERRLNTMVRHPPRDWRESRTGHVTLAWPHEVVLEDDQFAGFLMPAVDMASTVELHRVTNPSDRWSASGVTSWARGFTWKYLVRTAANLAMATHMLHESGVVIGDFNERNIRVGRDARVTLLDCDSMQVSAPDTGERFLCRVGRPEFTPPELLNADWSTTVRHPSSDLFALAIHIYQLLLEGEHPFRGLWKSVGDKPAVPELARRGLWTHEAGGPLKPRPSAILIGLLPDVITEMFRVAFEEGAANPEARPTADAWYRILNGLGQDIRPCPQDKAHEFWAGLPRCPWCAHIAGELGRRLAVPAPGLVHEQRPAAEPSVAGEGLRTARRQVVRRRIELGEPTPLPITQHEIETIPKLFNALANGDEWEFCVLRITPTFHDGEKYKLSEARVLVNLETPGRELPGDQQPKVWWMEPGSVVRKVHHSRSVQVNPGGSRLGGSLGLGADYDEDEPFILAYGTQCPSAYWKFMKTRGRSIMGSHELTMVVRLRRGHHVEALIEIDGTCLKRRFGVIRAPSDAGNDRRSITLSPNAIRQAKINYIHE